MQQKQRSRHIARDLLRSLVRRRRLRRLLLKPAGAIIRAVDATTTAYQPVDDLGIDVDPVTRARVFGRWDAMRAAIEALPARTAVDIGAAEGFYAMRLAEQGFAVVALEGKDRPVRILATAITRTGTRGISQLRMTVEPDNVDLVPRADVVVLLAVWHHWVRMFGLDQANAMLASVWAGTRHVLFFETGEKMPAHYGLPDFGPEPAVKVRELLLSVCAGAEVRVLGRFPDRTLFAVVRVG